jgi:hypothetical protein
MPAEQVKWTLPLTAHQGSLGIMRASPRPEGTPDVLRIFLRRRQRLTDAAANTAGLLHRLESEIAQEQALQFGAAAIGFIGAILGLAVSSAFVLLPAFAIATLGQYLLQGWCPPLALLARLGLRSSAEIDSERYALTASLSRTREPHFSATAVAEAD